MSIFDVQEHIQKGKTAAILNAAFSSVFFPVVTAAVVVACYYLGWELVTFWYLASCFIAVVFCCRDLTPLMCLILFMNVTISMKHTPVPDWGGSDYLTRPEVLGQLAFLICIVVLSGIYRIGISIANGSFRATPVFMGLCALAAAMVLNGAFSKNYNSMNAIYGCFLGAVFVILFMLAYGNFSASKPSFEKIAYYMVLFSWVLLLELALIYLTREGAIVDGIVMRYEFTFGWGTYNNFGVLACMCIPASFYLAAVRKPGWLYVITGIVNTAVAMLCCSRQAIISGAIIFVSCSVWLVLVKKGKERWIDLALLATVALSVLAIILSNPSRYKTIFVTMLYNLETGSGRLELWSLALKDYCNYPVFGIGFYQPDLYGGALNVDGLSIIPEMYHNTFMELMGACGSVGLVAYLFHRMQTVHSLAKGVTVERMFLVFVAGALLIANLFDNHLFYILPTIIYTIFVALLCRTEPTKNKKITC